MVAPPVPGANGKEYDRIYQAQKEAEALDARIRAERRRGEEALAREEARKDREEVAREARKDKEEEERLARARQEEKEVEEFRLAEEKERRRRTWR